ncbi:ABC transporter ATP-binding protein [Streptococcus ratti]|uniref:ABC transporter, ATP-binding protein n=1 Tax=Streptococcus ratti FA-1 = DSM 20564 TaxID=699248 RepID=A0ABN0GVK6_STRRT|nr:ABC transporter ATP-binding protein [Streptococcus ratti]EJN94245.1 ABC transporter, ATP-binding protein [Streptococcus ratti FA-1 = DSM 20564]EMP70838.1 Nod factor export ATP-binding protein I [Streptococcus ratti FA-1 = DSM 20564]QEY06200.1 ABC transporter ATP-binding protein [Streptococcus ratti]VEI60541.1 ABC transporter ATP-binding protein [Streptococcus mutans]
MTGTVIKVSQLTKNFKDKKVLKNLSFEVNEGDCLALIGPNGSGKTTLFNCLLGDYLPTTGKVNVLGQAAQALQLRSKVGILFQENQTEQKMKVSELLDFQKAIYPNPLTDKDIDDLLQFTEQQKNQFAEKLSGGQRRLLAFVQVLVGQPDILILDEPTAGMDTSTRKRFWEIIAELKKAGKTIIYSSHYIEEVEHTADRILVLHEGKLLRDTTPYLLRSEEKEKVFTLPADYLFAVEGQEIQDLTIKTDTISFSSKQPQLIWDLISEAKCPIEDIEMTNRTLLNTIFDMAKEQDHENV